MKRYFLILSLLLAGLVNEANAAGISFIESKAWKEVLAEARRSNRPVFLDAYATWCGPCKYLQSDVFTDEEVGAYFNSSYINVKIDMEKGEGPALAGEFGVTAYPTLLFFSPEGKLVHKYIGALESADFIALGKKALDPERQYYTLAAKAASGQLEPEAFHAWVHDAEEMEEEGLDDIIDDYLELHAAKRMEKDMIELLTDHVDYPGDEQLKFLTANRGHIISIRGLTDKQYDDMLKAKVINNATRDAFGDNDLDYEVFHKVVAAWLPGEAKTETQLMRVRYKLFQKQNDEAVTELVKLLTDGQYRFRIENLGSLLIEKGEQLARATNIKALTSAIGSYALKSDEAGQGFYKDYCLMIMTYFTGDTAGAKKLADKLLNDAHATEQVKAIAGEVKGA